MFFDNKKGFDTDQSFKPLFTEYYTQIISRQAKFLGVGNFNIWLLYHIHNTKASPNERWLTLNSIRLESTEKIKKWRTTQ